MGWSTSFIAFRLGLNGELAEVYRADDLKQAKYWITYLAEPLDVLCRTPLHPKHKKNSSEAEYFSHKVKSGTTSSNQAEWLQAAQQKGWDLKFPHEQVDAAQGVRPT